MWDNEDGANINGPSLMGAPEWLPNKLGKYYLYFGHHSGRYIRLSYSNHLAGPWKIHSGGVLPLEACPTSYGHMASPDIHLGHASRQIRMYYHSPCREAKGQHSLLALSDER